MTFLLAACTAHHAFLPREVPFGIGSVFLARVFCLIRHISTEVRHDLRGKQLHGAHDLRVRDLAQIEGTVQVSDASVLGHAVDLLRDYLWGAEEPVPVEEIRVVLLGYPGS